MTCSYVVKTRAGLVLVDAGMDSTGGDMERALAKSFRATPADVTAILLTHWHNDHAAGAQVLKAASGAQVFYHEGDQPQLTGETAATGFRGWLAGRIPESGPLVLFKGLLGEATPNPVQADQLVVDGHVVADDFEVIETPGHTAGHACYYYHPERILFAGDALAVVDERVRFMARPVTPDLEAARASMVRCLERPVDHLCPGHRQPLSDRTQEGCDEMRARLAAGAGWPWLG